MPTQALRQIILTERHATETGSAQYPVPKQITRFATRGNRRPRSTAGSSPPAEADGSAATSRTSLQPMRARAPQNCADVPQEKRNIFKEKAEKRGALLRAQQVRIVL
ncbi:MAG: hypothetical protein ACLVB5_04715 [Christensenellales bacterium]